MKKEETLLIAGDYPHTLMLHIRTVLKDNGWDMLWEDSFVGVFQEYFPNEEEEYYLLKEAYRLEIPKRFQKADRQAAWSKRVCITQSLFLLMKVLKEYEAVTLVESFMCLLGWDIKADVERKWKVKEDEKAKFHVPDDRMMPGGLELERRVKEREEQMKEGKGDRMGKKGRKKLGYEEQPLVFEKVEQNGKKVEENAVSERGNGEGRLPFRDKMSEAVPKQMGKPSLDKEDEVFDERKADTQKDGEALSQNREVKFLSQMNLGIRRELKRARRGDGDSQEKLGSYYAEEGTKHLDYEEAIYWYQLAAKKGNFKAQMGLGQIFDSGKVQDADSKAKGIFWFQKLASEGFPTAQCILGLKYLWGDGVEEDRKEAMKWLQRAADQGYEQARLYLDDEEK